MYFDCREKLNSFHNGIYVDRYEIFIICGREVYWEEKRYVKFRYVYELLSRYQRIVRSHEKQSETDFSVHWISSLVNLEHVPEFGHFSRTGMNIYN